MIGNIKVASIKAYVLMDPEAIHSFISSRFFRKANIVLMPINYELCVSTPNGNVIMVGLVCPSCTWYIGDHDLVSDLMVLEMKNFDIILKIKLACLI